MNEAKYSAPTEERVTRLEAQVSGVISSVEHLADDVRKGFERVARIQEKSATAAKTQWGPLVAAAGVLLALVGQFGAGMTASITRNDRAQSEATALVRQDLASRYSALRDLLKEAEDKSKSSIDAGLHVIQAELDRVRSDLSSVSVWQNDHDKRVVGINAAQSERIISLERAIYDTPRSPSSSVIRDSN